jgi:hypothetical protein
MNNISKIQQTLYNIKIKEEFAKKLIDLMEKYNIKDSIFQSVNNNLMERTSGYFEVISEHETFEDAMDNWNGQAIRIINNQKFQLGNVKALLSECKESIIYDIDTYSVC